MVKLTLGLSAAMLPILPAVGWLVPRHVPASLAMIPYYGAEGAVLAIVVTRILGGVVTLSVVARGLRPARR